MTPVVVCDASAIVAALLDGGPSGSWAARRLRQSRLAAPHLMPFEAANIVRRQELAGTIGRAESEQAHADLLDLDVELWPHEAVARAAWGHRHNLSIYDASYVGLADALGAPLVTLDARIARSPGIRCAVETPPT
ncbi:type II toxin-antitoxin system VapC family toxin [Patulibacter sp.]|uniref:type II toxin-antitoxin system VapC family toxin n=1 Tax=Patulibacter sp. TaxID=1912859 RepID=UPI002721BB12|nr:type II toxin-antitoxin system VapC family toxin [Patulibacter sp.]MDO9407817.1 type II toxin-antitoxin system VapC family toxin [Patulibacter sp.]